MMEEQRNWISKLRELKDRVTQKLANRDWAIQKWNLNWDPELPQRLGENLKKKINRQAIQQTLQNFDPQKVAEWSSQALQKRGAAFYGTLATISLSTYFAADVTSLILAQYIPETNAPRTSRFNGGLGRTSNKSIGSYSTIFSRNLFNSQGLIPGDDTGQMNNSTDPGGAPIKSTLPLNLIGTLIMINELRSIATIEDKTLASVFPMRVDDEIPNKIKIIKIETRRVTFVNKASNRREYIDLPEDAVSQNPIVYAGKPVGAVGAGIEKVAATQYNISRSEVDRALADFNNILTQARAVPNFENGVASGYKLFQIVPGSIYDKLGLQNGDIIAGLNGSPINDPAKAFEMLSELKTSNHLELQVKKDGKQSTYTYDIH